MHQRFKSKSYPFFLKDLFLLTHFLKLIENTESLREFIFHVNIGFVGISQLEHKTMFKQFSDYFQWLVRPDNQYSAMSV